MCVSQLKEELRDETYIIYLCRIFLLGQTPGGPTIHEVFFNPDIVYVQVVLLSSSCTHMMRLSSIIQ
jgi:hypothetical protein